MKKILIIGCLLLPAIVHAQVSITPVAGLNSTRMSDTYGWQKGGNFALAGVEFEFRKRPKPNARIHLSAMTGVSYLANGFYYSSNFAFTSLFYSSRSTNLKMQYWQAPVMVKVNWQPFAVLEDWKIFFGAGISNSFLIKSHLEEKSTSLTFSSSAPPPPPATVYYEDSRDITNLRAKHTLFQRFELGMLYKKFHLAYRLSFSLDDMYPEGLEDNWNVPDDDSYYIRVHQERGVMKEKYAEIVVGYRVFNGGNKK